MSGLEAAAAFGLACNVMQTITFAKDAYEAARSILKSGSPDPRLSNAAKRLSNVTRDVETSLKETSDELPVKLAAKRCMDIADEIQTTLDAINLSSGKRNVQRAIFGAFKLMAKTGILKRLEGLMSKLRQEFDTNLLVHITKRQDHLDVSVRNMLQALPLQHAHIRDDISQRSHFIEARISAEAAKSKLEMDERLRSAEVSHAHVKQLERLLESLHYPTMNQRRNAIGSQHHKGTYQWLFNGSATIVQGRQDDMDIQRDERIPARHLGKLDVNDLIRDSSLVPKGVAPFIQWLRTHSADPNPFWICGKPGSGKSTFVWHVADTARLTRIIKDSLSDGEKITVAAHFLWEMGSAAQKSFLGILRSLVYQLVSSCSIIVKTLANMFPELASIRFPGDWSESLLTNTLLSACQLISGRMFIFLDGLDEIIDEDTEKLFNLIECLSSQGNLKICASSRPETRFTNFFASSQRFQMQQVTVADIATYCYSELADVMEGRNSLSDRLIRELCEKSEGVFLWAALAVRTLRKGHRNGDDWATQMKRLQSLLSGLFPLYTQMWARLNEDQDIYKQDAARYFRMLLAWNNMLHGHKTDETFPSLDVGVLGWSAVWEETQEFLDALPTVTDQTVVPLKNMASRFPDRIATRCAGLLEVASDGKVQMIHRSGWEFLKGTSEGQEILSHDETPEKTLQIRLLSGLLVREVIEPVIAVPFGNDRFSSFWEHMLPLVHAVYQTCSTSERQQFLPLNRAHSVVGYMLRIPQYNTSSEKAEICWIRLLIAFGFVEYFPMAIQQLKRLSRLSFLVTRDSLLRCFCQYLCDYPQRQPGDMHTALDFIKALQLEVSRDDASSAQYFDRVSASCHHSATETLDLDTTFIFSEPLAKAIFSIAFVLPPYQYTIEGPGWPAFQSQRESVASAYDIQYPLLLNKVLNSGVTGSEKVRLLLRQVDWRPCHQDYRRCANNVALCVMRKTYHFTSVVCPQCCAIFAIIPIERYGALNVNANTAHIHGRELKYRQATDTGIC